MRLILLAMLLVGCEQSPPPERMSIKMVYVNDEAELKHFCGDDLIVEPLGCARGGAMLTPKVENCTVYVMRPRGFDDHRRVETIGHEVLHCFDGPVHK